MSGNGVDVGQIVSMLRSVLQTQEQMRVDFGRRFEQQDLRIAALRAEVHSEIASLRETVTFYHSSVVGQGIRVGEMDERLGKIENHPTLRPPA